MGRLFFIAKAGMGIILTSLIIGIVLLLFNYYAALPFLLFSAFSIYFFRDPERSFQNDPDLVISPADGRVLEIIDDVPSLIEGDGQRYRKLSIFMSIISVHVNRAPYPGIVKRIEYKNGNFYPADKDEASLRNESNTLVIENEKTGARFIVKQIAGILARRIKCWVSQGDTVQKGQRFGMIKFGSRVEILIPKDFNFSLKKGDKVKAGETVIGGKTKEKK